MKLTISRGPTVASIFTTFLVIASLCSIIIMQTDNAFEAKILFQVSGKFNSSFQDTLALCGDKEPQLYTISVNIKQFSYDRMG